MRVITTSLFLFVAACAGPSHQKLAETPTAQTKQNTGLAPAASTSDEDREQLVNSVDDQYAAERARKEAGGDATPAPTPKPAGSPGKAKPAVTPASPEKKN